MSDDLVKQAMAELTDVVRCRCNEAYTGRGLRDPDCQCDSAEAVKVVADRIEELEAKLSKSEALLAKGWKLKPDVVGWGTEGAALGIDHYIKRVRRRQA